MIRISAWTTFKGKLYKSLNLLIYGSLCLIDTIIFFKIIIINDVATKTNQLRETYNPCKPLMTRKKTMGPPKTLHPTQWSIYFDCDEHERMRQLPKPSLTSSITKEIEDKLTTPHSTDS